MDTPFLRAAFQVVLGGVIVLAVGIAIGVCRDDSDGASAGASDLRTDAAEPTR